jgi:hypothetical protein
MRIIEKVRTNLDDPSIRNEILPPKNVDINISANYANIHESDQNFNVRSYDNIWNPDREKIGNIITRIRDLAEAFRENHTNNYLDKIDRDLLNIELSNFQCSSSLWDLEGLKGGNINNEQVEEWNRISNSSELRMLAKFGYKLYREIFPRDQFGCIDLLPMGSQINIHWCRSVSAASQWIPHIPWGLMFQIDPPHNGEIDPMYFLGLRYRIAYRAYPEKATISRLLGSGFYRTCYAK